MGKPHWPMKAPILLQRAQPKLEDFSFCPAGISTCDLSMSKVSVSALQRIGATITQSDNTPVAKDYSSALVLLLNQASALRRWG